MRLARENLIIYVPASPPLPSPPSTFRVSDQFNNHIITKIGGGSGIIDNADFQVRTTEQRFFLAGEGEEV